MVESLISETYNGWDGKCNLYDRAYQNVIGGRGRVGYICAPRVAGESRWWRPNNPRVCVVRYIL